MRDSVPQNKENTKNDKGFEVWQRRALPKPKVYAATSYVLDPHTSLLTLCDRDKMNPRRPRHPKDPHQPQRFGGPGGFGGSG